LLQVNRSTLMWFLSFLHL